MAKEEGSPQNSRIREWDRLVGKAKSFESETAYPTAGPITSADQEQMLASGIRNLRMVHLPSSFHKVQLLFPATCANHLLHFAAQHDGTACRES